jgi:hypothetical protein
MRPRSPDWDIRRAATLAVLILIALALRLADANPARSQAATLHAWRVEHVPSMDPGDPVWASIAPVMVPLTAQQGVYAPGGGVIPMLQVKAVHARQRLFVHIEWTDASWDISTQDASDFADAIAMELPSKLGSSVPAVCMGQADAGVNIWQWRADRQASLSALDEDETPIVDFYPSEQDLWFPAREAGNPYAVEGVSGVQNLVARSFGTIGPASEQPVSGRAEYEYGEDTWSVVFSRSFAAPGPDQPGFAVGGRADVAFAVWDGSNGDRDGQKSVSQFVQMSLSATGQPASGNWDWVATVLAFALVIWILFLLARGAWRSP